MAITAMARVHMYDGRGGSNKMRTHAWWKKKKKKSQYMCPLDHSPVWHEETEGEEDRSMRERGLLDFFLLPPLRPSTRVKSPRVTQTAVVRSLPRAMRREERRPTEGSFWV